MSTIDVDCSIGDLVPEDAIPVSGIVISAWIDEDGSEKWSCWFEAGGSVATIVGLLELTKLEAVARLSQVEEEDDG